MKKIKKWFRRLFVTLIIFVSVIAIGSVSYYHVVTSGVTLDTEKLDSSILTNNTIIYDANLSQIKPNSSSYINLSKLSINTTNAFLCAEDKRFFRHGGIDYIRILGATISNIKTHSFSQGASTISQQLVKNTHLTNEKTINRKLKEIKLTKELEKRYSKEKILELYLNNIYFGNGCYGIENASNHYFGKSASNLSLSESAALAGSINAPSVYDIENNTVLATKRRNLILNLMHKYKKIDSKELSAALQEEIKLNIKDISGSNTLFKNILDEAKTILKASETKIQNSNYKIYTSIDKDLCKHLSQADSNYKFNGDIVNIVIDNKTHSIVGVCGKTNILDNTWQPGSTIKPILVYAPAIEKDIISPATKILDEKINISGYTPENADKTYHGYISTKQALAKSYNIPAVKILNELGIENAKTFASNLGITFDESDNHLALALGGFKNGVKPITLCDAYSAFANNGKLSKSSYITKITKDGKTIYEKQNKEKQVMKDSTAFLITDMLKESVKTGTAKRLSGFEFDVASKTGTVGKTNSSKNKLAYNIAYTKNHTLLTMIVGENLDESINGASYPTIINKQILSKLYSNVKPPNFSQPQSVKLVSIDKNRYEKNEIAQSDNGNTFQCFFQETKLPASAVFDTNFKVINSKNSKPIICFTLNNFENYTLKRIHKKKEETISSFEQKTQNQIKIIDKTAKNNSIYEYFLTIYDISTGEIKSTNSIKIKTF